MDPSDGRTVAADLLAVSGGWNPNVALWTQARGTLRFDERIAAFVPDVAGPGRPIEAVGAAAGDVEGLGEVAPLWVVPPLGAGRPADAWAPPLRRPRARRDGRRRCSGRSAQA